MAAIRFRLELERPEELSEDEDDRPEPLMIRPILPMQSTFLLILLLYPSQSRTSSLNGAQAAQGKYHPHPDRSAMRGPSHVSLTMAEPQAIRVQVLTKAQRSKMLESIAAIVIDRTPEDTRSAHLLSSSQQ